MTQKIAARLIITFACDRDCPYCCNKYRSTRSSWRDIDSLADLESYQEIIVTGGEPMLQAHKTLWFLESLRDAFPDKTLYLYAAVMAKEMREILPLVDGVCYTLHADADARDMVGFYRFQDELLLHKESGQPFGSYRLSVDGDIDSNFFINPSVWSSIKIKKWLTEKELGEKTEGNGAPIWEDLLVWTGDAP